MLTWENVFLQFFLVDYLYSGLELLEFHLGSETVMPVQYKVTIMFLCLISSLPGKEENNVLMLEDSTLNLMLDILCKVYQGEVWLHNDCLSGSFIDYFVDFSLLVLLKLTFFFSFVDF
ncbi:uncharacterized protein LOC133821941 [Humulus lupulus]|uniref:uncharacterized protein LOC133821941 n=1 Tax=Humulus lupulus TaxID=3486 RepID=UPI002B4011D3|nr:uncharacterized protein LOC133821941 [Humulus lupulus]